MNHPVGFGSQVPQNHPVAFGSQVSQNQQGQVPMLAASSNPQTQLNNVFGNVPNTLNPPPFMPGPSFPNGSNMAAFNALMMQNGIMGIQNMQCQPPNFNVVAGFPYQGQFYNAAPNLNQIAGQQLHGQFNLQGMWPQTFAPNVNQIMSLLQGQMNSQNNIAPMNSMFPQQCSTNPFGQAQATPSNSHMFSQYMAAPSCPSNIMFPPNTAQLQAIPRNLQSQFAYPPQPHQNPKEILTERNDETSNAKLGSGRQSFAPSPQGNWKKENSQTRFLKSNSHHVTNERGGMRSFDRNRGAGTRNGTQKKHNGEISDHLPRGPRRCLHLSYTAEEIRQWREARRRNYPTASKIAKVRGNCANDEAAKARRKQLRDILAKQAELGVEVAELPNNYLSDPENQNCNRDHKNNFHQHGKNNNVRGRFQNKFSKRGSAGRDRRCIKRYKPMNGKLESVPKHSPSLLQKLLSADIKKDQSKLLQVFRFATMNSFFEHWPEEPLIFPQVTAKDAPFGGDTEEGIESISDIKNSNEENVDDMNSDEDYGSDESDDNVEEDDHELSDKSEEGEI